MNKATLLREFMDEMWNKKNYHKIEHYIHQTYTIHLDPGDPWEGKTLSHSEYIDRMKLGSFNSFPDMQFEITSTIEAEMHVAVTWNLTGTHLGHIGTYAPTHKAIKTKGMTIYHFKNGMISGHTQIFDRQAVMSQLGFI